MTPQRLVAPQADPAPKLGPVLVSESAAIPAKVLPFPAAAPSAADALTASRTALLAEFLILFGALPLIVSLPICAAVPRLPILWIAAACVLQPKGASPALLIFASAAAFATVHLLFHNWIAVAATFPGGILFARRHLNSRSLLVSSIEHALYGCFLFTIGLGQFFALRPPIH